MAWLGAAAGMSWGFGALPDGEGALGGGVRCRMSGMKCWCYLGSVDSDGRIVQARKS